MSNNYNTVETRGGRAALKFDLGDNWTITPTVMGQTVSTNGFFGYDPRSAISTWRISGLRPPTTASCNPR